MTKKTKKPCTPEDKAYGRGYTAGRKRERRGRDTVIRALNRQVDHWRRLYTERATDAALLLSSPLLVRSTGDTRRDVVAAVERVFARVLSSEEPFDGFSRQEFIDEICASLGVPPAADAVDPAAANQHEPSTRD